MRTSSERRKYLDNLYNTEPRGYKYRRLCYEMYHFYCNNFPDHEQFMQYAEDVNAIHGCHLSLLEHAFDSVYNEARDINALGKTEWGSNIISLKDYWWQTARNIIKTDVPDINFVYSELFNLVYQCQSFIDGHFHVDMKELVELNKKIWLDNPPLYHNITTIKSYLMVYCLMYYASLSRP